MRITAIFCATLLGVPVLAQDPDTAARDKACSFQAEVVGAVQTARLDRVRKDQVVDTIVAANPSWPAQASTAAAPVVDYVYSIKRRDLKKVDLAKDTFTQCIDNWAQLQEMQKSLKNGS